MTPKERDKKFEAETRKRITDLLMEIFYDKRKPERTVYFERDKDLPKDGSDNNV